MPRSRPPRGTSCRAPIGEVRYRTEGWGFESLQAHEHNAVHNVGRLFRAPSGTRTPERPGGAGAPPPSRRTRLESPCPTRQGPFFVLVLVRPPPAACAFGANPNDATWRLAPRPAGPRPSSGQKMSF